MKGTYNLDCKQLQRETHQNLFAVIGCEQEPKGNLGIPMDISSPITSDEEYLSPLEESMDFGGPEPRRNIDTQFRKPPAFLVRHS